MMALNASHETKPVAKPYAIEGFEELESKHALVQVLVMVLRVVVEMDRSSQILEASSTFGQVLALS